MKILIENTESSFLKQHTCDFTKSYLTYLISTESYIRHLYLVHYKKTDLWQDIANGANFYLVGDHLRKTKAFMDSWSSFWYHSSREFAVSYEMAHGALLDNTSSKTSLLEHLLHYGSNPTYSLHLHWRLAGGRRGGKALASLLPVSMETEAIEREDLLRITKRNST